MSRRNRTEVLFKELAIEAGFEVCQPKSIRVTEPVEDMYGRKKKFVTTPDFFILIPGILGGIHIEITNSSGDTPHKLAQKRVADQAGVLNYLVITGDQINNLASLLTSEEKHQFLIQIFSSVLFF